MQVWVTGVIVESVDVFSRIWQPPPSFKDLDPPPASFSQPDNFFHKIHNHSGFHNVTAILNCYYNAMLDLKAGADLPADLIFDLLLTCLLTSS